MLWSYLRFGVIAFLSFSPSLSHAELPASRILGAYGLQSVPHQAIPHGVPDTYVWQTHAEVVMGANPTASAVPNWYEGPHYSEWRGIDGWFTVYEATNNRAQNISVEIADIELWYLAKNNVWHNIVTLPVADWAGYYPEHAIGNPSSVIPDGNGRLLVQPGNNLMAHGGTSHYATPWGADGADIQALFFSLKHRLVADANVDISQASYIVNAGIDFVPFVGAQLNPHSGKASYWPGAGLGQFIKSTTDWQYASILITDPALTKIQLTNTLNIPSVPEPSFYSLLLVGLCLIILAARRQRRGAI